MIKWRKSSRSDTSGGQCVEVAGLPEGVGVRVSKNPDESKLSTPDALWPLTRQIEHGA